MNATTPDQVPNLKAKVKIQFTVHDIYSDNCKKLRP